MNNEERLRLSRPELYKRILKIIREAPARKSTASMAYFTTDHLRAIYNLLVSLEGKCQSSKIR